MDFESAPRTPAAARKIRPRYEVVDTSGPDHEKTFAVAVYWVTPLLGTASGRSKREAEHRAMALAVERLASRRPPGRPPNSRTCPTAEAPRKPANAAEPTDHGVRARAGAS